MSFTYSLKNKDIIRDEYKYYTKEELEMMTTYQLREICIEEKIVNGTLRNFDKDEYIYQILRFRGREKRLLITEYSEEGYERLEYLFSKSKLLFNSKPIRGCAKVICYEKLSIEIFDNFTIGYHEELIDTNALLVNGSKICAIFQIRAKANDFEKLYITKSKDIQCKESNTKNYMLYCMGKEQSDFIYSLYNEERDILPDNLTFYLVEILNFEVRKLINANMPLAIDFGTSNTTAGMYLDDAYFEEIASDPIKNILKRNDINYLYHFNLENNIVPTLPTVIGINQIEENTIHYVFGYEATRLFQISHIEDGFSIFYDIKRFVSEPDKQEEIVDKNGYRKFINRRELIKKYLEYIIDTAKQRFKCNITHLHISAPVKQKKQFHKLFSEILPEYILENEIMLDEGVAVLYNSISDLIKQFRFEPNVQQRALIIDCGGGTTDLSSCTFSIESNRVSYKIDIETYYENGDTDFGGNNLTYRIMQLIKIALAYSYDNKSYMNINEIIKSFDIDLFRAVDNDGTSNKIYELLEKKYLEAEKIIPTRFKDYEQKSRSDYYAVKNNFYYLFDMAEKVKTIFYKKTGVLRIALSTNKLNEMDTTLILVNRWKLYVREKEILTIQKDIPVIYFSIYDLNLLLKADIYNIIKKFIGNLYENDKLSDFTILRLTGQSCKIDIFRDALKEFIPGKLIESTKKSDDIDNMYELKLICLNGAIKYIRDIKFGFADVNIYNQKGSFPYIITALTHEGKEKLLINGLNRKKTYGHISRNMADVTLKLFLKDMEGNLRYTYSLYKNPREFIETDADTITSKYKQIIQDDLDDIEQKEMKFFVISEENDWGFLVIPVYRLNGKLYIIEDQFFSFETEGWLTNFFDGTR